MKETMVGMIAKKGVVNKGVRVKPGGKFKVVEGAVERLERLGVAEIANIKDGPVTSKSMNADDAIAFIEGSGTTEDLVAFLHDEETRVTVVRAYEERRSELAK
jgi:hypothetical protein